METNKGTDQAAVSCPICGEPMIYIPLEIGFQCSSSKCGFSIDTREARYSEEIDYYIKLAARINELSDVIVQARKEIGSLEAELFHNMAKIGKEASQLCNQQFGHRGVVKRRYLPQNCTPTSKEISYVKSIGLYRG